jgi:hypothetical protein
LYPLNIGIISIRWFQTKIIKKQPVGEGFYEVEIDGKPYQITLDNYAEFLDHADEKPMTEWWIRVSGNSWLLLTEDNVIY